MSAPSTDLPAPGASTSSSGYSDGLGRRALAFDREDGTMLERLVVRPELAAFEPAVRERIDRLAALDDERIAKPRSIERDSDGSLVLVSEFVPGSRLADLLDTSVQQSAVPGVDVALGYLLDVLPALCGLHAGAGFPHGTISPGRTILTPAGQVVLLDAAFGAALGRLHYSRRRLWIEFGIALPPSAGAPRLDESADLAQAAMAAVMLVTGRPLGEHEFPGGLAALVNEIVEVAQIRGTSAFAKGLQDFLQRALPLPGRKPYASADDALIEIRGLANELGLDGCRRALVDFIEQMEAIGDEGSTIVPSYEHVYTGSAATAEESDELELSLDEDEGTEVDLDADPEPSVYDLSSSSSAGLDETDSERSFDSPAPELDRYFSGTSTDRDYSSVDSVRSEAETTYDSYSSTPDPEPSYSSSSSSYSYQSEPDSYRSEPDPIPASLEPEPAFTAAEPSTFDALPEPEPIKEPEAYSSPYTPEPEPEPAAASASAADVDEDEETSDAPAAESASRRRKRTKSVRARKDKLRSTTAPPSRPSPAPLLPPPTPAAPAAPMAAKPAAEKTSWLIPPNRAASFDAPVPEFQAPASPPTIATPPAAPLVPPTPPPVVAPQILAPPPPVTPPPPPAYPPAATSWTPSAVVAPPPAAPPPKPAAVPTLAAPPAPIALKLKDSAPKRPARPPQQPPVDIYSSPSHAGRREEETGGFPWKLAAAAIVVITIGIVAARAYLPGGSKGARPTAAAPAGRTTETPPKAAPSGATGRIQIETQPAGARVLLNGKAAGESPLTLDAVPVGRHTLTFISGSGTVRKTVRVEAGKTATLDVAIFSGWVGIFAPIVLEVSENGRAIGTTEQSRLMLPPGRHELTLTNRALGYSSVQTVDIEPGEVRSLTIEPRGKVNFNAIPWAEVWIDGQKVGETPIANLEVALGVREVLFKHPQFGERRSTITVKGNAPAAVVVDMSK